MKGKAKSKSKPTSVSAYLKELRADQREVLQKLRRDIQAAAPAAEECISYGIPAFRLRGKFLLGFGAAAKHCALYLGSTTQCFEDELKGYKTSKGTIRFQPDSLLPTPLVKKLVKARIADRT